MKQSRKRQSGNIPGWNSGVKHSYKLYKAAHRMWQEGGEADEDLFYRLKAYRQEFRRCLKRCRRDKEKHLNNALALEYAGKSFERQ